MKRLILFLIRKRLGLRKGEGFRFANQKNKDDYYYFTSVQIVKVEYVDDFGFPIHRPANVALNWLLDEKCMIRGLDG